MSFTPCGAASDRPRHLIKWIILARLWPCWSDRHAVMMALDDLSPEEVERLEIATGEIILYSVDGAARVTTKSSLRSDG